MSQEGYADPITHDAPGFHSITPVSELTELVFEPERPGQATKLSPSDCEEPDGVTQKQLTSTPTKARQGLGAQTPKTLGPRLQTRIDRIYDMQLRLGTATLNSRRQDL